jgi:hypothetical protein
MHLVVAPKPSADLPAELKGYQFADVSTAEKDAEGLAWLTGMRKHSRKPLSPVRGWRACEGQAIENAEVSGS